MSIKSTYLYNAEIAAIAGNGGDGYISFIRNGFIAKGGPDGGNGGRGGSVYLRGKSSISTLIEFRYKKKWQAENAGSGKAFNKTGKDGMDEVINIPIGTEVFCNGEKIFDVLDEDVPHLIAYGGAGGYGNKYFASPILTTPYISTKGNLGQSVVVKLTLKYMADIGVIGLPSSGKSTFVGKISKAKVKIGDYDFSTINPVIGVFTYGEKKFVIADLPGLIKGASDGKGLGYLFLQHVERCKVLLHFVDISKPDFMQNFQDIYDEIKKYNATFLEKKYFVCLTKTDLINEELAKERLGIMSNICEAFLLSEYNQQYIDSILQHINNLMSI